ncbi:MAG: DUF2284 domain-containing protein [Lachnospiraceae bacterium]|jgi:predicted metal-binding protein|nr:DUF2284 domain-containing protein [Lachnospiraceae bacterium]
MNQKAIEAAITNLPICDYAFISIKDIPFKEEVRHICRTECPRYGKSWSCPPAVGTVEECQNRCKTYEGAFLFTTMAEVPDLEDMEGMLATRKDHEKVTRQVRELFFREGQEVLALSTESCAICEHCTYPEAPCRFPDRMFPSVEGFGILVTGLAEQCGITFLNGNNLVTWFSLILYREKEAKPGA